MPTHQRETILEEMRTVLAAAGTSMGTRVRRGRTLPVMGAELPMANIFQGPEASDLDDVNRLLLRDFEAAVQVFESSLPADASVPDIDTKLNELARQVEVALQAVPDLNGKCLLIELMRSITETEHGERDVGSLTLVWRIRYRTVRTDPSSQG